MKVKIGKLRFIDGWGGGEWQIDGKKYLSLLIAFPIYIRAKGTFYKIYTKTRNGVDHDMGHTYKWSNIDFYIQVKTPLGIIDIPLRERRRDGWLIYKDYPDE